MALNNLFIQSRRFLGEIGGEDIPYVYTEFTYQRKQDCFLQ